MSDAFRPPRRVLIVGGGPSGLTTLRNFKEHGDFEEVHVVERRDAIGGVWYQPPPSDTPVARPENCERWPRPAYPGLVGNVLPEFLSLAGHPFHQPPVPARPFPTLEETNAYILDYARSENLFDSDEPGKCKVRIRLNTEVISVDELESEGWRVVLKDWSNNGESEEVWDGVVVTTVWFDNPRYPVIDGLDDALKAGGEAETEAAGAGKGNKLVRHSIHWKGTEGKGYEGKRIAVVGCANSANEIAAALADVARTPVFRSVRRVSIFPSVPNERIRDVAPIERVEVVRSSTPDGARLKLNVYLSGKDGKDGEVLKDIDHIICGTGYAPHVPYLRALSRSRSDTLDEGVPSTLEQLTGPRVEPMRVPSLYRHTLYAPNPTLAFVGAAISFVPFVLSDLTSTWLALAWRSRPSSTSNIKPIPIPPTTRVRLEDEQTRIRQLAAVRAETDNPSDLLNFHFLGRFELEFAQLMRDEVYTAEPGMASPERRGRPQAGGLLAWDEEQDARRWAMYTTKLESLYWAVGREPPPKE